MSIQKTILSNMILEREMLYAKRYATIRANLPVDGLDKRIALLQEQIATQKKRFFQEM